tara:strand:+ start:104 stop:526 length:423 start_codon:yes stop_codon:yes gene_type:complete
MLKMLPKTAHHQTICEANFLRLNKILYGFKKSKYLFDIVNPDLSSNSVIFKIIASSKHTLVIEAEQKKHKTNLESFVLKIQVSLDAKLAEVISYQGEKAFPFFRKSNSSQSKDEKLQQNRFLTEWLECIFANAVNSELKI